MGGRVNLSVAVPRRRYHWLARAGMVRHDSDSARPDDTPECIGHRHPAAMRRALRRLGREHLRWLLKALPGVSPRSGCRRCLPRPVRQSLPDHEPGQYEPGRFFALPAVAADGFAALLRRVCRHPAGDTTAVRNVLRPAALAVRRPGLRHPLHVAQGPGLDAAGAVVRADQGADQPGHQAGSLAGRVGWPVAECVETAGLQAVAGLQRAVPLRKAGPADRCHGLRRLSLDKAVRQHPAPERPAHPAARGVLRDRTRP